MKIVILGGRGLIGGKVVDLLRSGGHEVVAASPSQGVNSITREGLTEAITGAQVVVDVTNSPSFEIRPCWNSSKLPPATCWPLNMRTKCNDRGQRRAFSILFSAVDQNLEKPCVTKRRIGKNMAWV